MYFRHKVKVGLNQELCLIPLTQWLARFLKTLLVLRSVSNLDWTLARVVMITFVLSNFFLRSSKQTDTGLLTRDGKSVRDLLIRKALTLCFRYAVNKYLKEAFLRVTGKLQLCMTTFAAISAICVRCKCVFKPGETNFKAKC